MLALNTFEYIIDQIRSSNLNFQLQMSPFSAQISLKRSFVKEKADISRLPTPSVQHDLNKTTTSLESAVAALTTKNLQLEKDLDTIKSNYAQSVDDCQEAYEKIRLLENEPIKNEDDVLLIEDLKHKLNETISENKKFKEVVKEQKEEIFSLQKRLKIKDEISNTLNKQLNELRNKHDAEIARIKKAHKAEVKSWKKDLGEERREKLKIMKKLEKARNDDKITEPKAETFAALSSQIEINCEAHNHGNETSSDNGGGCLHDKQCILRQPYPPPSPLSPFIVHDVSKYHIHMMNKTEEDLTGCIRCFSVDNENYGCDKCTWLKWWFKWHGDRHGFPDLHPSIYRKYL